MTYVIEHGGSRGQVVTADFYNYWPDKPYVTFWKSVRGKDVPVATLRVEVGTSIRPR